MEKPRRRAQVSVAPLATGTGCLAPRSAGGPQFSDLPPIRPIKAENPNMKPFSHVLLTAFT